MSLLDHFRDAWTEAGYTDLGAAAVLLEGALGCLERATEAADGWEARVLLMDATSNAGVALMQVDLVALPPTDPANPIPGTEGQDRESYTDTQDRDTYTVDPELDD